MPESNERWSPAHDAALEHAWGEYRVWAATARRQKADLFAWRLRVLLLTVIGAVLGTLSYQLEHQGDDDRFWDVSVPTLGILAGITVGLATYFSREIISPGRERHWVRARSVAEALKSETFRFRTGIPPFHEPGAPETLLKRVDAIEEPARDVQRVALEGTGRRERLPAGPLSMDAYIAERVDDQIERFYIPRARQHETMLRRGRSITLFLGGAAVVLGVVGVTGWTTGWVAALGTLVAAVGAYLHGGRYQYLIVSYQTTAAQLQTLNARWG
ncbi:MAG: DUF4231 domain-containing protein, partial [Chloroflexia bacterium]|nr:DUF4231 domain-containing protein [Chloroflexia bacterium]